MLKQFLIKTTHQKILAFFADHPDDPFHEREVVRQTRLGKGQVNKVLNELYKTSVLSRDQKGKMYFYSLNDDAAIRQFRILKTVLDLEPLVEKLKPLAKKIILYGSRASGTNLTESDMDFFVVSKSREKVYEIVRDFEQQQEISIEIKTVIRSLPEWMALEDKDPIYFNELLKGIVLWEKPIDESRL